MVLANEFQMVTNVARRLRDIIDVGAVFIFIPIIFDDNREEYVLRFVGGNCRIFLKIRKISHNVKDER